MYSKRKTLSKASQSAVQALAVLCVSLGSLWLADRAHLQLDEQTRTSIVVVLSTGLMGTAEALRNWLKHKGDK